MKDKFRLNFEILNKKLTFKNMLLLFLTIIKIFILISLYIHVKTLDVFNFIGNFLFVLAIYYLFLYISQNLTNYNTILHIFAKYALNRSKLAFSYKDTEDISHGLNIAGKLLVCLILGFLLYTPLKYLFSFTHEVSHAIVAIFYRIEISDFQININGTSYVQFPYELYGPKASMVLIAGSLGVILLGFFMIILLFQNKTIKIEIFLPLMILISNAIISNIEYWIIGARDSIGDAWDFLQNNPSIDSFQLILVCTIIRNEIILVLILLFGVKIFLMIRKKLYDILPDFSQFLVIENI